jgi:hypothetical protein
MSGATRAEVEELIRSLGASSEDMARRLASSRVDLQSVERAWRDESRATLEQARAEAEKLLSRELKAIEANVEEVKSSASSIVGAALAERAPGYLSADWSDTIWSEQPPPRAGEWLRVGTLPVGRENITLALPLSAGVWSISSNSGDRTRMFVQNAITRVMSAFDPGNVRITTYDPDLSLDLAAFAALRAVSSSSIPPAITSEEEFEAALDALRVAVAGVDDRLTAVGQDSYWGALARGHSLATSTPLRLLVIGPNTQQVTDRGAARLDQLRRLAADRGLLIIEPDDPTRAAATPGAVAITLDHQGGLVDCFPGVRWDPDPWAGDRFIRSTCARLVERPRVSTAPTVSFETIVDSIADPWMNEADDGVEAVVGVVDGGELLVRLRAENPPMPNALIGGAVGQGKSNLLLVLIHSLAARYSPAELEMVLVDLRDGVEFARLGPTRGSPTWLPHVRALGLEFDPDYSLGVLRWVQRQMTDRSLQLKEAGATTLKQYRVATGRTLPRLLVVIDEFQRLFEGDEDQVEQIAKKLDLIARTGRGFGVHLVLASQAITGIQGLAARSEAIFGQFHNRLVLKNTAAESQAFLASHNLAAADLEYRGQMVVNDGLGTIDKNRLGTVAYADGDYLEQLQVRLFQQGHGSPPSIFRASAFAAWRTEFDARPGSGPPAVSVGLPLDVEAEPRSMSMRRAPDQALAVVGTERELAVPIVVRAVSSAARSMGSGAHVTILDGGRTGSDEQSPWLHGLVGHLTTRGHPVQLVHRENIGMHLVDLAGSQTRTDLIVGVALDSVDLGTPVEPDFRLPSEALRDLVRRGPLDGTWTIAWWQSKTVLEEHLGYRAPGVRGWAFAGVSRDDLTDIAGTSARQPARSPRFVWFDRTSGSSGPEALVPFDPADVIGRADVAEQY